MAPQMQHEDWSDFADDSNVKSAAESGYQVAKKGTDLGKRAYDARKAQKAANAAKTAGKAGNAGKAGAAASKGIGALFSGGLASLSASGLLIAGVIIVLCASLLILCVNVSPAMFTGTESGVQKTVNEVKSRISSDYNDAINAGVKNNSELINYLNSKVTGLSGADTAISGAEHADTNDIEGNARKFSCDLSSADYHFNASNTTAYLESDYCRINFDFTPSLEEQTEIIYAYTQAVNGALSAYSASARESGTGTDDISGEISRAGETAEEFDYSKLGDEQYIADFTAENGNEYNTATSKAFIESIGQYADAHTLFFMNHDPSTWLLKETPRVETKTRIKPACRLSALPGYFGSNASKSGVAPRDYEAYDCNGTPPDGYTVVDDPDRSIEIKYLYVTVSYTIPVFFDMSSYKLTEINNVLTALHDEEGMDPDLASESLYSQISTYYKNYITMFGLEEVEAKVLQAQAPGAATSADSNSDASIISQIAGLPYMGVAPETLNGADSWLGDVASTSGFNYAAYQYAAGMDDIYSKEAVHRYQAQIWAHVAALANEGKIRLSYPPDISQCTNFAQAWVYDHWGIALPGANGNEMANKLISQFPDMFENGNAPAPGGIISILPNHVMCCDAVVDSDGDGAADYYVISDGNVMQDGVRIQMKVSVAKYIATWGGAHPIYANPKNH